MLSLGHFVWSEDKNWREGGKGVCIVLPFSILHPFASFVRKVEQVVRVASETSKEPEFSKDILSWGNLKFFMCSIGFCCDLGHNC